VSDGPELVRDDLEVDRLSGELADKFQDVSPAVIDHESDETVEASHAESLINARRTDQVEARNPSSGRHTSSRHPHRRFGVPVAECLPQEN